MVCDFRAIYRLSWWEQVERGDVDETQILVAGLKLRPDSLYRASAFDADPPAAGEGGRRLGWFGWSQETALLMQIHNALVQKGRLSGPPTATEAPPETPLAALQRLRMAR